MEIVLAALVAAGVAAAVVALGVRPRARRPDEPLAARAAPPAAEVGAAPGEAEAPDEELRARRSELARLEERLRAKEQSLDLRGREVDGLVRTLDDRERNLEVRSQELKKTRREQLNELERVARLSIGQARQILLRELEHELRHDSAKLVRQVEEETRHEADRRARSILSTVMQRIAGGHAIETTVSVVELRSDELKGRIIGREGRNIRTLETI